LPQRCDRRWRFGQSHDHASAEVVRPARRRSSCSR
jgi:hypothetical protein